jgi:hypothetical protein
MASTQPRLTRSDFLLLSAFLILELAVCLVHSHGRLFWADELFGAQVLGDPSFTHMFTGWREGVDGGGGAYYLLCRLWIDLAGLSELSLRLFSSLGFMASTLCLWLIGRRVYTAAAITLGLALVFFTSPVFLWQMVNGRFYGMLLATTAFAGLMEIRTSERDPLTGLDLALTALAHALLCGSHILGLVYSAVLILAAIATDRANHRWRPRLYLAAFAGWTILIPSYTAIRNSTGVATTVFWTHPPTFRELGFATLSLAKPALVAVPLLLLIGILRSRRATRPSGVQQRLPLYLLASSILLAELILFVKSRLFGISIFADRYLIPVGVATVLLIAELYTHAFDETERSRLQTAFAFVVLFACTGFGISRHPNGDLYPTTGLPGRILQHLPPDQNVVVTGIPMFSFLRRYDPTHHYIYLLDWDFDLSPARRALDHSGEYLMENRKRAHYEGDTILSCRDILTTYPSFTMLVFGDRDDWVRHRLPSPAYNVVSFDPITE